MSKLICLRGYPGSGKTTLANKWVREADNRVRVSRDDLRATLFSDEGVLSQEKESLINKVIQKQVTDAFQAGFDVIVDATNLRLKYAREWAALADKWGAEFSTWDVETPVEECVERNRKRGYHGGRYVPEEVIRDYARKFPFPLPPVNFQAAPVAALEPAPAYDVNLPDCVLVDIDGTVALIPEGGRSPYDRTRVSEDIPNRPVIKLVNLLRKEYEVIFVSGREGTEQCRRDTLAWLSKYVHWEVGNRLYMRPEGDMRNDAIIKLELYDKHIRGKYNVKWVIDDRARVVKAWRSIGLTVLAVADGDF